MKDRSAVASLVLVLAFAFAFSSCSNARKKKGDLADIGLLGALQAEPVLTEKTVERLQEIADDPSSSLSDEFGEGEATATAAGQTQELLSEDETPELEFAEQEPREEVDPSEEVDELVSRWKKGSLDPRSIEVGDIFSDHSGPILKKAFSLADHLDLEDWTKTIASIADQQGTRVPVTLSLAEINALQDRAPLGTEFPTRSVALDFRTVTQRARQPDLEKLYHSIENTPEGLTIEDEKALGTLAGELSEVRSRLKEGESLYVITGVTRSDEMKATYPGAPLGSRDADLIENAVSTLYPHLDNLSAEKREQTVYLTRDPGIYWEFEIRELKLDEGKIAVDEESLAQR